MQYTIHAVGVGKAFAGHTVLDGIDLAVAPGEVLALLGPNGAGKTTLVRILATLLRPDSGTAVVHGHDLLSDPGAVRRVISLTGQFTAVDAVLTGRENLEMLARLRRVPRREAAARVTELLEQFDLTAAADRRAGTYSGGMKRRLDVAISMITRPALLFLDEPTTGLDPRSRDELWRIVQGLAADGVTVLLTTQYLEEADQLADSIAMLDHGRIVAQGSADTLKGRLGGAVLRLQFSDLPALREAAGLLCDAAVDERLAILDVPTDGTAEAVQATLARLPASGTRAATVSLRRPTLDDVFLSLTDHRDMERSQ